jgi:hypothetical protein
MEVSMGRKYVLDTFLLQMLSQDFVPFAEGEPVKLTITRVPLETAREAARGAETRIGGSKVAALFSRVLGIDEGAEDPWVSLGNGDTAIVGQLIGPVALPGANLDFAGQDDIKWFIIETTVN